MTVLDEIRAERELQDAKWGQQNHDPMVWLTILGEELGEAQKAALEVHFDGKVAAEYRAEMVQVAAVAVAAIESLDRK